MYVDACIHMHICVCIRMYVATYIFAHIRTHEHKATTIRLLVSHQPPAWNFVNLMRTHYFK